jgi:hypothetical protein
MLVSKIKEIKNGRVIVKDSKIGDANPDGTISPDEEKRMAELLREANESKSRLKAKAYEIGGSFRGPGNWKRVKSILTSDSKTKDANIVNAGNIKGINWKVRKDIKNGNVIYIGESDLDDETFEGAYPAQVAKELMNWIIRHAGN